MNLLVRHRLQLRVTRRDKSAPGHIGEATDRFGYPKYSTTLELQGRDGTLYLWRWSLSKLAHNAQPGDRLTVSAEVEDVLLKTGLRRGQVKHRLLDHVRKRSPLTPPR